MYKKWIINNGRFIMGHVELHRDLVSDNTLTIGGGWWHFDKERNVLFLYYKSQDFGSVSEEAVRQAKKQRSLEGVEIFFSTKERLEDVINDYNSSKS